jgi:hypothetical protein
MKLDDEQKMEGMNVENEEVNATIDEKNICSLIFGNDLENNDPTQSTVVISNKNDIDDEISLPSWMRYKTKRKWKLDDNLRNALKDSQNEVNTSINYNRDEKMIKKRRSHSGFNNDGDNECKVNNHKRIYRSSNIEEASLLMSFCKVER